MTATGMLSAYHPAWGRAVNYTVTRLPEDPDGQVEATVNEIIRWIRADSRDPQIQSTAQACLESGGGDPLSGVWAHVKQIRFQQDYDTAQLLSISDPRLADAVEVLIRPVDQPALIAEGKAIGDCDCFQLYGLCLLHALGVPTSLITVAADRERYPEYSHIYGAAYLNGRRIPLDFSHGPYPGWECRHLGRIREWPVGGSNSIVTFLALAAVGYWAFQKWSAAA